MKGFMKIGATLLLFTFLFGCSALAKKQSKTSSIELKINDKTDATPEVLSIIKNLGKTKTKEIIFEKGVYHFYPDKALEKFCYMSNHDDLMVKTAFPLLNLDNVTINGNGSTFIFHGVMIPFLIEESSNIQINNVTIDWAMPFHSEGEIIANNKKEHSFDLKISNEYPYEIRNEQLYFIKEYYEHNLGESILYDKERYAVAYNTEAYTPITLWDYSAVTRNRDQVKYKYEVDSRAPEQSRIGRQFRIRAEEIKPGIVRIYNHGKKLPEVGKILIAKGLHGENRIAPAFRLLDVENFKAKNVTVHHAGGMGLIAQNCKDIELNRFEVSPSNGRMVSTTADATHFVGCAGKVELIDCVFQNQLDDATNVHGTYQKVVDVLDDHRLGVRMGHFQQLNFDLAKPGDQVGVVRLADSFHAYHELTVVSTEKLNDRYHIITFKEKVPSKIKAGDLLENLTAYPSLTVRGCNISNNRARGLLLSTPKKVVIENNYFHTEMSAILIPVESGHWYESGSVSDLVIRNNVFQDCNFGGLDHSVIRFVTDDDNQNIAFKNIVIEDNTINTFDHLVFEISNTQNLVVKGNKINKSNTFSPLFKGNPIIQVKSSENIVFDGNEIKNIEGRVFEIDDLTKKNSPNLFKNTDLIE
ncbi:right-handed parallel beta-helix repeat-containing protein [Flammeovirga sp. MY04]|uniref:right-handed parallel beta-helix repeat-containing protein n=1 Tax=Flammeovirga sp. MY04 TaxID=1191459 RepID=UPI00080610A2|nr:right-handed parallel beta-helix repeat-containing protein [Flammeovirga sp. MY04]ANQ47442.1 right-handed parallel beta-helix repeat-containing protein [Flammeovirga sp. MY04]